MVASFARCILAEFCLQENGQIIPWTSWKLSPDMKYILVKANHHKVCTSSPEFFSVEFQLVLAMETFKLRQLLRPQPGD